LDVVDALSAGLEAWSRDCGSNQNGCRFGGRIEIRPSIILLIRADSTALSPADQAALPTGFTCGMLPA
jgi:hypothetical protein